MPYEAPWPEFDNAVSLIAEREDRERGTVADELVDAIRARDVKVRWPDISADAAAPTDWRWFGRILGTGAFKDVLVCRADIDRWWPNRESGARAGASLRPTMRHDDLRKWYARRINKNEPTSEEADWEAARQEFGVKVRRYQVRELRRELAPEGWRKQGRRRKAAENSAN